LCRWTVIGAGCADIDDAPGLGTERCRRLRARREELNSEPDVELAPRWQRPEQIMTADGF